MMVEITFEAFRAIVSIDARVQWIQEKELAFITSYCEKGVNLQTIENHVSATTQYYIEDINA